MGFFIVVTNLLFWGAIAYWIYNSSVKPRVKSYQESREAKEFTEKWGGMEEVYSDCVEYLESKGFESLTTSDRKLSFKNRLRDSLWECQLYQQSREEAKVTLRLEKMRGNSYSSEVRVETGSNNLMSIYIIFIRFAREHIDKKKESMIDTEYIPEKEFEQIFSRSELYSPIWSDISNDNDTPEWARRIIEEFLAVDGVFPQNFFENYRYLKMITEEYSNKPGKTRPLQIASKDWDEHVTISMENIYNNFKSYEHVPYPYWYISAYPDIVLDNKKGKKKKDNFLTDQVGTTRKPLNIKDENMSNLNVSELREITNSYLSENRIETRIMSSFERPNYKITISEYNPAGIQFDKKMLT